MANEFLLDNIFIVPPKKIYTLKRVLTNAYSNFTLAKLYEKTYSYILLIM